MKHFFTEIKNINIHVPEITISIVVKTVLVELVLLFVLDFSTMVKIEVKVIFAVVK